MAEEEWLVERSPQLAEVLVERYLVYLGAGHQTVTSSAALELVLMSYDQVLVVDLLPLAQPAHLARAPEILK